MDKDKMDGVPPPVSPLDRRPARLDDRPWVEWRRQIGRRLRALRELTGLSQTQLGRIAGTNQAALSRLESGRGCISLSLVARLGPALAANLIDRRLLSAEGERMLSALETLAPSGLEQWLPLAHDSGLHDLIRWYQRASAVQRKIMLAVVRAVSLPGAAS
jgi:transcriptional regulator with XRE-family HTH domain